MQNEKALHSQGLSGLKLHCRSAGLYIGRTWTLFALTNLELNLLAFVERCITGGLYLRVMDK
jgi:hypothetical protein